MYLSLNLHEDTSWDDEPIERFDCPWVWLGDIDDSLMCADLELLSRFLVDVDQVVVDRALIKLEVMNAIRGLADALTIIAEARSTVNLRYGSLHQMTLTSHEFTA